ncbi:GTP cyclohydrolase I [Klebsiella michiganensis]|uniref:GTP cyclohydrolase I n=1 Tax=Klebsiella michiganensis TaxID=1134687 RepID=A0A7H4PPS0_9ENTR|nr:GTP cyclohydrolase I [Klebsiella michiganensis]
MVTVRDITLTSTCEHHFVTIDGKATVAYIPKDSVIGLSKINRIVQFFSQRPQVQERLTQQILTAAANAAGDQQRRGFHRCGALLRESARHSRCHQRHHHHVAGRPV